MVKIESQVGTAKVKKEIIDQPNMEQKVVDLMEIFGEQDRNLTWVSPYCDKVKFNHVKAAETLKCEWIFLKKINGINRHWTRIGSDLNAATHVNKHLERLGFPHIVPEIGNDYYTAKAKGFKETFVHPGYLGTLNKEQKKILLENIAYEPGNKGSRKNRKPKPVKFVKRQVKRKIAYSRDDSIRPVKKPRLTSSSLATSILSTASSAGCSVEDLQNEGFQLLQRLSTWIIKVSEALRSPTASLRTEKTNFKPTVGKKQKKKKTKMSNGGGISRPGSAFLEQDGEYDVEEEEEEGTSSSEETEEEEEETTTTTAKVKREKI